MTSAHLDLGQVRRHFSAHADDYDRYARVQKGVADRLVALAGPLPPGLLALDVGTGTGAVGLRLRELEGGVRLVVSDLAHGMTRTAHTHLPGAGAVDADAHALPFLSGGFDLVLSASVFQWVEDLQMALGECFRVLRPGGRFALALFVDGTLRELKEVFRRSLGACRSQRPFHFQEFPQVDAVRSGMQRAGFRLLSERVSHEVEYHASLRDLLVSLKKIGAQNASNERPGGLFPRRVLQEMEGLYRENYNTPQGLSATYSVLYCCGEKPV